MNGPDMHTPVRISLFAAVLALGLVGYTSRGADRAGHAAAMALPSNRPTRSWRQADHGNCT